LTPTTVADPNMTDPTDSPSTGHLEGFASWTLRWPLTTAIALLVVGQLALWVPHYLTWPLFADHDVFMTPAQGWDHGIKPYRDVFGNNFPGTTYIFWLLGHGFGWGKELPFHALDAAMLGALGVAMVLWGRRRLGAALPALIGFATFVTYYLGLDYSQVGQRDWHAPFFAVLGLLAAETWPGRPGRWASAIGFALAFSIRPQPVLLLPAMLSALDEGARPTGDESWRRWVGASLEWGILLAIGLVLVFAPLWLSGIGRDFLRGVRLAAYGQPYNRFSWRSFAWGLVVQVSLKELAVPLVMLLLIGTAPRPVRRTSRTWLLAMLGVLFYRPISPLPHVYLKHPLMLIWSVNVAVLARLILGLGVAPSVRLAMVLLTLGLQATIKPRFSNPNGTLDALPALRRGGESVTVPPGYVHNEGVPLSALYNWEDYRGAIEYLRRETGPETRVANALKAVPAINGPAGRLPVFPAESLAWLYMIRPDDVPRFAEALEEAGDSVVVWAPEEDRAFKEVKDFHIDSIEEVIRRRYEPIPGARFGLIEVWRRKPGSPPARDAAR
jgi:hypothetical protein